MNRHNYKWTFPNESILAGSFTGGKEGMNKIIYYTEEVAQ